jgi:predicted RNA-binding protein YlxR (DUF448 family)
MNVEMSSKERERRRGAERRGESRRPERTCVGCGLRDDAAALLRVVVGEGSADGATRREVAFDLAGGAFGRGAHLHAQPACIEKAPRGLARSFRGAIDADGPELGLRLVAACDRRLGGLLLAARRSGVLTIGADATVSALAQGAALAIVASDAGSIASSTEVGSAVADGRAIAWSTKGELGGLLGERSVAICAVRHAGIAGELKRMRVAADAGAAATTSATREGAECSRFPEAR